MIHRRRKTDANQASIVAGLRAIGSCVIDLSASGGGVMDLLVIYRGRTHLVEVKNPKDAHYAKGKMLTPAQIALHSQIGDAGGEVHIVTDLEQAIALVTKREC